MYLCALQAVRGNTRFAQASYPITYANHRNIELYA